MSSATIVDAGPIIAFLNRADAHHGWAKEQLSQLPRPLLTCEAALADACLVRMTEIHSGSRMLTLDGDFRIYRRNGRQIIDLIIPEDG